MKIVGLQKVSLLDYPEHIAATVFFGGCNLDCGYCHNRWMLDEAAVAAAFSVDELLAWLATRVGKLDGVCFSGGEPTLHPELPELARRVKALSFHLKLDTNGILPQRLAALLDEDLLDYVAMDLKAPLTAADYARVTRRRIDPEILRRSMALLRGSGVAYEFRTTVCPGLDEDDLRAIAAELLPGERWFLQPFVAAEAVEEGVREERAMTAEELLALMSDWPQDGAEVRVRAG